MHEYIRSLTLAMTALIFVGCGKNNDPGDQNNDPGDMAQSIADMSMTGDMPPSSQDMGSDLAGPGEDMPGEADMPGEPDLGEQDMGDEQDMMAQDMAPDLPPSACEGECKEQTLTASAGAVTEPVARAVYGLTHPDLAQSMEWEIYIEALDGGFQDCPGPDSPTPNRSILLPSLPLPTSAGEVVTDADGLGATLLDYQGTLLMDGVFTRSSTISVTHVAADLCTECVGMASPSHEAGYIALDLTATFESGATAQGHIYATHCDSLDTFPGND